MRRGRCTRVLPRTIAYYLIQHNKTPELSAKVFTSSCKVVNIEDINDSQNINKNLIKAEFEQIKNKLNE